MLKLLVKLETLIAIVMMESLPDKVSSAIDKELNKILQSASVRQIVRENCITERKILEDYEAAKAFKESMIKLARYAFNIGVVKGAEHASDKNGDTFIGAAISRVNSFENTDKKI